ncbi:hypothetical protein BGW38_004079 [Lunasporangiospora selenospora]|uniref:BZIP domain-containing protein n=1 Tax=Lunasporangiospora selenospora TaxID=979761 RepID=A0A9P6FQL7_9FUNG|nr:hypothetical protein BGW38_004079 [Lunasporangiospora selenospora]
MTSTAEQPQRMPELDRPDKRPFADTASDDGNPHPHPHPHPIYTILLLFTSTPTLFIHPPAPSILTILSTLHRPFSLSYYMASQLQPPATTRKKPGRKPNPASPAVRKEQNRAAQRAFRDRKERHLQQLENLIKELKESQHTASLQWTTESQQLKNIIESLQSENYYLREVVFSFESALAKAGHTALLQDVKAELYRRHYENHAARKLSTSQPSPSPSQQQQQQPSPANSVVPESPAPLSMPGTSPTAAPSPSPVLAHAPSLPQTPAASASTPLLRPPMVVPGPVPVDDRIPHAVQVQMLNQALVAAMAAHAAASSTDVHKAFLSASTNLPLNSFASAHGGLNPTPSLSSATNASTNANANANPTAGASAWTQLGLTDPEDDNIFSMNSEILYKAPSMGFATGPDDTKTSLAAATAYDAFTAATRSALNAHTATWLPKQTSTLDDIQATMLTPGAAASAHGQNNNDNNNGSSSSSNGSSSNLMSMNPDLLNDANSLFGQPSLASLSPNQNMFSFTPGSMDNVFPAGSETPVFLDSDDVDSNEFSMTMISSSSSSAPLPTMEELNLKQNVIPSYRLQMEIQILASAQPATDPHIDPKIYAMPHDSRIDLIPCPKLRAQMILHQHDYDIEDLCQLLIGGAICHGHPLDPHNWEVPQAFFDRYGYLMGAELMKYKNKVWPKDQRRNSYRSY